MSGQSESHKGPFDSSTAGAIQRLTEELRAILLAEAKRNAGGGPITEEHIFQAYQQLGWPSKESIQFADAQGVISRALKENRAFEWVACGMALILFAFGLLLLCIAAVNADTATRIGFLAGGSITELLVLLPFRFVVNSRRQNIALRMLGLVINRVDDPKKLAPLLKDTFLAVVLGKVPFKANGDA